MIQWHCKPFESLTNLELYRILQLRSEVFVVEQNSVYPDCDNKDLQSYHLSGWEGDTLIAYSRILPPDISYPNAASFGRVVISPAARGQNLGRQLVSRSLENLYILFGRVPVIIGAQFYLVKFYETFSFVSKGEMYVEDGVQHIAMEKSI